MEAYSKGAEEDLVGASTSFTPSLFKAGPARGYKRHKLSPLSTPAQEEDSDSLGVTHLLHPPA